MRLNRACCDDSESTVPGMQMHRGVLLHGREFGPVGRAWPEELNLRQARLHLPRSPWFFRVDNVVRTKKHYWQENEVSRKAWNSRSGRNLINTTARWSAGRILHVLHTTTGRGLKESDGSRAQP